MLMLPSGIVLSLKDSIDDQFHINDSERISLVPHRIFGSFFYDHGCERSGCRAE